jgi:hypothetical protein
MALGAGAATGVRLGLGELLGAGMRAVSRYTGTVFAVFLAQSLVALAATVAIAMVLAQQFANLPMFDKAVDGDLVAGIWCIRYARSAFLAIGGIVFAAVLLWQLVAWFVIGGLVGVFAQRPEGRGGTARCFGASGTATYLTYARLWLCGLPGLFVVLFLWGTGLSLVETRIAYALTVFDLVGALVLASLPALLVLHFLWTVSEYARVELTLRHDTHDPGVVATYLRTLGYVIRRPITLVHGGLGWLLFLLVTLAYAYLAHGPSMYGAEGAITLFFVRQVVSLLRTAIKIGILAGQVELGRTRPMPRRRVEAKASAPA